jgi:heat shock protein 4
VQIGVARKRGVDIIANETSNRQTPCVVRLCCQGSRADGPCAARSLVGFGVKQRAIGEAAKTQETSNFRNTIGSLKRLIGRTLNDKDVQEVEKKFLTATLVDVDGTVGAEVCVPGCGVVVPARLNDDPQVKYVGETHKFSATQLVATYLGKLRDITAAELKSGVSDVVITVPGWYTDIQRRALMDAAQIAGLNPLRLLNDYAAVALGYGITKSDLPEEENPRHVVFVDVGHSSMSVAVIAFSKGRFVVKATAFDRNLGGRDIDYALVTHFAEEFKQKYKIDVLANPKATFRLQAACEKLKKVLSANSDAPLNVESIMSDVDAAGKLSRDQLEELVAGVLARIPVPIEVALRESGLTLDEIDAVELVGGSTRVPAVRAHIQQALPGKTLSSTLNQDEAVARGATFACAMLSPVFKVREFAINDVTAYPIRIQWAAVPGDDDETALEAYTAGNAIPSTKVLSFDRKDAFDLEAVYAHPEGLPGSANPWIARFSAKRVELAEGAEQATVRVKVRVNQHGIFSFEQAYIETVEEKAQEPAMEVDAAAAAEAPKKKRIVHKKDVPFVTGYSSLDKSVVDRYAQLEAEMHAADKLVTDTEDRKNALEEYVYDMRGKLDDRFAAYVQAPEKEKLLVQLQEAEDWLYTEEGEDATKSAYVEKLDLLKVIGDPISARYREAQERAGVLAQLRETINTYMTYATNGDERYAHIDAAEKEKIVEKCATTQKWLEDQAVRQSERAKNVDPVLTSAEVLKRKDEIIYFATPILSKPKPKTTTTTEAPPPPQQEAPKAEEGPTEMDVD